MAAGIDETADADHIAHLPFADLAADLADHADDLVARHHREHRAAPLVAHLVYVGMTHPAVFDVDLHLVRAGRAALDAVRCQRRLGRGCGVSSGIGHGEAPGGMRDGCWRLRQYAFDQVCAPVCKRHVAGYTVQAMARERIAKPTKVARLCRARLLACSRLESGGRMPGFANRSRLSPPCASRPAASRPVATGRWRCAPGARSDGPRRRSCAGSGGCGPRAG